MAKQQNWDSNTESECKLLELIYSAKLLWTVICYTVESPIKRCALPAQQPFTIDILKVEGASLVAQWLKICLPMQGTQVRALVWEDPTCRGATRPVSHN